MKSPVGVTRTGERRIVAPIRVLALDVGTTYLRAGVFDESGALVSRLVKQKHGAAEDANGLAAAALAALEEAGGADDAAAVGVSCFWHSLIALDPRDRPLTPVLGWRRGEAAEDAATLAAHLDGDAVYRRTGCPLHASYWPAKLAWLRRTEPALFASARRFVSFAEFVCLSAGVRAGMSLSNASATGLLGPGEQWDAELLDALSLTPDRLPPLSDEPVESWVPPIGDGACANLGAGCVTRDRAALTIGTSGALRVLHPGERTPPPHGLFTYLADRARVVRGGAVSDGGNVWYWLRDTLRLPATLDLGDREPDGHGLTYLPLLGGERSPGWNATARGAISGLRFETTALDIAHAALEAVALRFADIADLMPELKTAVATGGAMAANESWMQVAADALGKPLARTSVAEASLRGAAVYALERLGHKPPAPPVTHVFEPRPERTEIYRAARERQRRLYDAVT